MVGIFNDAKPCEDILLEFFCRFLLRLVFNIENRREVPFFQFYMTDEMLGLGLRG